MTITFQTVGFLSYTAHNVSIGEAEISKIVSNASHHTYDPTRNTLLVIFGEVTID